MSGAATKHGPVKHKAPSAAKFIAWAFTVWIEGCMQSTQDGVRLDPTVHPTILVVSVERTAAHDILLVECNGEHSCHDF